ncbi:hypothetical protein VNO80_18081 [Phaseolus coccineus]|uniref:Uncharacterized protein n=1 Tax=Phaseolus coccineus TaxID=3886 RepID=A0AAN9QZ48_PHACN
MFDKMVKISYRGHGKGFLPNHPIPHILYVIKHWLKNGFLHLLIVDQLRCCLEWQCGTGDHVLIYSISLSRKRVFKNLSIFSRGKKIFAKAEYGEGWSVA